MSENQARVCVDTNRFTIFSFAWGMLKTGESILPSEFCLIEGLEAYIYLGEQHWLFSSSGGRNLLRNILILISVLNLLDRRFGGMII